MKTLKTNNLGKKYLVEQCQKIEFRKFLEKFYQNFKFSLLKFEIALETGQKIEITTSKTAFKGLRYWFKCPKCNKRVGKLLKHPISQIWGCRTCLGLEYRCRRYKNMIENTINKS